MIDGIPWYVEESTLTIELLTAFNSDGWELGHNRIIARNWMREPNPDHAKSDNRWRFTGIGFIRFKTKVGAEEYIDLVKGKQFSNPSGRKPRHVTAELAAEDQEFKRNEYPGGPQYYEDVWVVAGGNMEHR